MVKDCHNCEHHTWGDEWWNCKTECNKCKYTDMQGEKVPSNWKPLPMTNADRIQEKLAEVLSGMCKVAEDCDFCPMDGNCPGGSYDLHVWDNWLQQPAEGD